MLNDVRYALRAFTRAPGFALTAAATLAIGIGANTAMFTVVYALLLKPLPFRDPARLIYLHDTFPAVSVASISYQKFLALRDQNRTLSGAAAVTNSTLTITGHGDAQQIVTARVTGAFFDVLGVAPLAGRVVADQDDAPAAAPVVVLSHGLWQRSFGGDPSIVGRTITADGQSRTVIGIMPASFAYPARVEGWVPLALPPSTPAGNNFLRMIGRMKTGVTLARTAADLESVSVAFNAQNGGRRSVRTYLLHDYLSQANRQIVLVLQGVVVLVLLVACANVANMLLARSVSRRRELAIRVALGAGPGRLLRQLLTESALLAALGGGVGILLAGWLLRWFLALAPPAFTGVQSVVVDRAVLGFTTIIAAATGLAFGIAPAWRAFRTNGIDGLHNTSVRGGSDTGARGSNRLLVVAEVALAMLLVVGAGLLVKSLIHLQAQDAGFHADGVLTFQLTLPSTRFDDNQARHAMGEILAAIGTTPGVRAVGAVNFLPLAQFGFSGPFAVVGREAATSGDRAPVGEYRMVTPGYFAAMGIPIHRGAGFTDRDGERGRPVVIINETMARQFWPTGDPIGAHLQLGMDPNTLTREIVGIVGDVRSQALNRSPVPEAYVPFAQVPNGAMTIAVRSDRELAALLPAIRARIAAVDSLLPIVRPQPMASVVDASTGSMRLSSTLTSAFALLAALLATVGVYSLVSYSAASRTREIGIRIALGAKPASVLRMVVLEGVLLGAAGLTIGLGGTVALAGTLRSMLFEVNPIDPTVLAFTAAAVLAVTAMASFVPAWRVMRVDPTIALRAE